MRFTPLFLVMATAVLATPFAGHFEAHGAPSPRASGLASGSASANSACAADGYELLAANHVDAGAVRIDNDGEHLVIQVTAEGGWEISAVHIFAGTGSPPSNKRGTVVPGAFPFETNYAAPMTTHTQVIPLAALAEETGDVQCGAAINTVVHAVVRRANDDGSVREESAFADGTPLPATLWGFSSTREVCCEG